MVLRGAGTETGHQHFRTRITTLQLCFPSRTSGASRSEFHGASARNIWVGGSASRHHRPLPCQCVSCVPVELGGGWHVRSRARLAEHRLLLDESGVELGARRVARYLPTDSVGDQRSGDQADDQSDRCRFCGGPLGCCGFPCGHDTLPESRRVAERAQKYEIRWEPRAPAIGSETTQSASGRAERRDARSRFLRYAVSINTQIKWLTCFLPGSAISASKRTSAA